MLERKRDENEGVVMRADHRADLLGDSYVVAWTPDDELGRRSEYVLGVKVGSHPDETGWSLRYACTRSFVRGRGEGAEAVGLREMALQLLFDGCVPADVLREFSRIPAWRQMRLASGHWAFIPGRWNEWNPHNDPATDEYWVRVD